MLSLRVIVPFVAAACSALVAFLLVDFPVAAAASKIAASTGFLAIAVQVGALRSAFGRLIFLGLLLSWFGDAFLIGSAERAFLAGLGAFLLAHIAYSGGFLLRGIDRRWVLFAALFILPVTVVVSIWLTPHLPGSLLTPVRAYTGVIGIMLILAIGTHGHKASCCIAAGAVMFFVSDLSVAATRLVETEFPTYVWGLPLYYGGQVLLALSTSQSRSH